MSKGIEVDTMEHWLKTTIPGLIVLGAVGSVLAVVALRVLAWAGRHVKHSMRTAFPAWMDRYTARREKQQLSYELVHGIFADDLERTSIRALIIYIGLHAARAVAMTVGAIGMLIVFSLQHYSRSPDPPASIIFAVSMFLFLYLTLRDVNRLGHLYGRLHNSSMAPQGRSAGSDPQHPREITVRRN